MAISTIPTPDAVVAEDGREVESYDIRTGTATMVTRAAPDKANGNEDSACLIPYGDATSVIVVADGLGGLSAAKAASTTVVKTLIKTLKQSAKEERPVRGAILDALEKANQTILDSGLGNATTVALVEIDGKFARPYHVGDSQILITGQRGAIKLKTIAHSPTGYAIESGHLDEDEALTHDERHYVANVVGAKDMSIEIGTPVELAPFDTVVVASDGLWDNVYVDEVLEIIRSGDIVDSSKALLELIEQRIDKPKPGLPSHADDVTFVLYRLKR